MNGVTAYASARKGVSGMMSGLDTDEIVKGMTAATTNRITKLLQNKQKNDWKTNAFQSITSKLTSFNSKYLSVSSPTSIFSDSFFQGASVTPSGDFSKYIKVTGNSPTSSKLSILGINRTATTSSLVGNKTLSDNKIESGVIDFSATGKVVSNIKDQTLNVSYGGKDYNIKLTDFEFTPGASDSQKSQEIADAVNKAMAEIDVGGGAKLSDKFEMKIDSGTFSLSAKVQADGSEVTDMKITGASGKLLTALGLAVGSTVTKDTALKSEPIDSANFETELNFGETMKGKSISITLNGVTRDIVFDDTTRYDSIQNFTEDFNKKLDLTFGKDRLKAEANADGSFSLGAYKNGTLDETSTFSMTSKSADIVGVNGVFNMESNSATNRVSLNVPLSKLASSPFHLDPDGKGSVSVNGKIIEYTGDDSIQSIMNKINGSGAGVNISYMSTTDKFSATAKASGIAGTIDIQDVTGDFAQNLFGTATVEQGQDAEIVVSYDGGKTNQVLQRDSNTFNVDGMNITITEGAEKAGVSDTNPITFTSNANTDEIVKGIKDMINDYNELTALVNKELSTKADRNYQPLSEEQKKAMTEKQIEDWESKAKAGVLYGDSDLRSLASELRFAFSFDVDGSTTLKDMGIQTSSAYKDNGKIILDETKLKAAIENDVEGVKRAFATSVEDPLKAETSEIGFAQRVKSVVDKYAKTEGVMERKGILVQKAGFKESTYTLPTSIQKEQESLDKQLKTLKTNLKVQEDRYYAQFTRLETYINQMNAQSSWLSSNA